LDPLIKRHRSAGHAGSHGRTKFATTRASLLSTSNSAGKKAAGIAFTGISNLFLPAVALKGLGVNVNFATG